LTVGNIALTDSQQRTVDGYQRLRSDREPRGERPFLIFQTPDGNVWGDARTSEESFARNREYVAASLVVPSDHRPLLEPWFGTGIYANMYGCPYVWREGLVGHFGISDRQINSWREGSREDECVGGDLVAAQSE
jgi:hypothetical protein